MRPVLSAIKALLLGAEGTASEVFEHTFRTTAKGGPILLAGPAKFRVPVLVIGSHAGRFIAQVTEQLVEGVDPIHGLDLKSFTLRTPNAEVVFNLSGLGPNPLEGMQGTAGLARGLAFGGTVILADSDLKISGVVLDLIQQRATGPVFVHAQADVLPFLVRSGWRGRSAESTSPFALLKEVFLSQTEAVRRV
jgi:hypothetical protein